MTIILGGIFALIGFALRRYVFKTNDSKFLVLALVIVAFLVANFVLLIAKWSDVESAMRSGKIFAIGSSIWVTILFYCFFGRTIEEQKASIETTESSTLNQLNDEAIVYRIQNRLMTQDSTIQAIKILQERGYLFTDDGTLFDKEGKRIWKQEKINKESSRTRYISAFIFFNYTLILLTQVYTPTNILESIPTIEIKMAAFVITLIALITSSFYITYFVLFSELLLHNVMAWFYIFGTLTICSPHILIIHESILQLRRGSSLSELKILNAGTPFLLLILAAWICSAVLVRYIARHKIKER